MAEDSPVKRTDLEKLKGTALDERRKKAGTPDRFGRQAADPRNRREQREIERAQGLVAFAVKLDADLVKRLHGLAQERGVSLNQLAGELLRKGLGE